MRLLIPHQELSSHKGMDGHAFKVLEPEPVVFISYPYEWSFSQLKDAALATLRIESIALDHGMTLKDASAFNIQFHHGRPVLIDTLSFERYIDGKPWVAYRQFCQHFIAPLALLSYTDVRMSQLTKQFIDGIPLDLAARLLPVKSRMNLSLLVHLHLHSKTQKAYEHKGSVSRNVTVSLRNLKALIGNLEHTVRKISFRRQDTEWGNYYSVTNYSDTSFLNKKEIVAEMIETVKPSMVWDLGANNGEFSRIACAKGGYCCSFDIDPVAVELNYLRMKKDGLTNLHPLIMDLTNPTPPIGWNCEERMSFRQRPLPDAILALALIHHLAISNNLPLDKIARFFSGLSRNLIIEFVPKHDSQVQRLLASRDDIFVSYDEGSFVGVFSRYFTIVTEKRVPGTERVLYLMKRREPAYTENGII